MRICVVDLNDMIYLRTQNLVYYFNVECFEGEWIPRVFIYLSSHTNAYI